MEGVQEFGTHVPHRHLHGVLAHLRGHDQIRFVRGGSRRDGLGHDGVLAFFVAALRALGRLALCFAPLVSHRFFEFGGGDGDVAGLFQLLLELAAAARGLALGLPWETFAVLSGVALLAIVASGVSRNHSLPHSASVIAARTWHMRRECSAFVEEERQVTGAGF